MSLCGSGKEAAAVRGLFYIDGFLPMISTHEFSHASVGNMHKKASMDVIQAFTIMSSGRVMGPQAVSSVAQSSLTLCDPMDCSMLGLPVHHQLPEFTQTHVHRVRDPSSFFPFSSYLQSFPASGSFFSSSHQVAKVLKFQL